MDTQEPDPLGAPLVSVIIPAWNAAASIERAVASVLDAPGSSVECIVVDDGSTDGTAEVVESLARGDPRVVARRLAENGGCSVARNLALASARGAWLAFLDADDRWLPGALEAMLAPTVDPSIRVVVGQRIWTDGERTWLSPVYDIPDIREPGRKSIATHPGLLSYASLTGKLFQRSLVDGMTLDGRILGDQPWTIRAMLRAGDDIEVIGTTIYEWTRPTPDQGVETITAAKGHSATRAAEMVDVAVTAYAEVAAETDVQVHEAARHGVKVAYLDRLIHSDIRGPVRSSTAGGDAGTARLYRSLGRLLASVPPVVLADSRYVMDEALLPPVRHWRSLDRASRSAWWSMLRPVLAADPSVAYRMLGIPPRAPRAGATMLARILSTRVGAALASAVISGRAWVLARRPRRSGT